MKGNHKHGHATKLRGQSPEYTLWLNIRSRCFNKKHARYDDYGGRGIKVCKRWRYSFEKFLADIGPRPSPDHSLDRFPDNDGDYEPGNVRWATRVEQGGNRRDNRRVKFKGETKTLNEWARTIGIYRNTLAYRLDVLGWPTRLAFTKPVDGHNSRKVKHA